MLTDPDRPGVLVVIPARGGSKGVPLKNLERVGGVSLVARAVDAALAAPGVTDVAVSTDHAGIAARARRHGAHVVERPAELSGDTASSEAAVLHALDARLAVTGADPQVTVMVQATSPFIDSAALGDAVRRVLAGEADVVLSATPTHAFHWRVADDGAHAVGHDAAHRPRRQDLEPRFRETGAFYVMRTAGLREHRNRFFGRIDLAITDELASLEIDTPADLEAARALAPLLAPPAALDVDALVTDFDGVHTDDAATVDTHGTETVRVRRGDGLGVAALRRAGVPMLILSTEQNPVVARRAEKLGVEVAHGIEDKAAALTTWIVAKGLSPDRVAYVGNDVNDLPALAAVGWPVAVADARPEVLRAARLVLDAAGGQGAVREACDRVLRARRAPQTTVNP